MITVEEIKYYHSDYSHDGVHSSYPNLNPSYEEKRYLLFDESLGYLTHVKYVHKELTKLEEILRKNNSLENEKVSVWIKNNLVFFNAHMLGFGIKYLDSGNDTSGNLHLPSINEYVEKKEFVNLIKYWECMWLLSSAQYHLRKDERVLEKEGYYYSKPDSNEITYLEKALKFLDNGR